MPHDEVFPIITDTLAVSNFGQRFSVNTKGILGVSTTLFLRVLIHREGELNTNNKGVLE